MKLTWLKISGVFIWFIIEVVRWLERQNLIKDLNKDLMKKFEDAHKKLNSNVQSARVSDNGTDYSRDPDNRDN